MNDNEGCEHAMLSLQSGLYPGGFDSCFLPFTMRSRDELLGSSGNVHRACTRTSTHLSTTITSNDACAAVIMMDGWEIKNDYPW